MRKVMKKRFIKLAALALSAAMVLPFTGCTKGSDSGTIKIGVLFSDTGSTAVMEKTMTNACKMAFDEINAAGGIKGKKIEYIHEDYASDPATCTEKIKELIEKDHVVATVGCCTSEANRLLSIHLRKTTRFWFTQPLQKARRFTPTLSIWAACQISRPQTSFPI
jgi:branched-chain amino acid transport system substrate-binding protein/urea transport system substrate-binding protein